MTQSHEFHPRIAAALLTGAALLAVPFGASGQPRATLVPAAKIYRCPASPNMTGVLPPDGAWISNQQIFKMKVHDMQAVPMTGGGTTIICHYIGAGPAGPNWTGTFGVAYSQTLKTSCKVAGSNFVCS